MSGSDDLAEALSQLDSDRRAFVESWEASTPAWKDVQRERMEQQNVAALLESLSLYRAQLDTSAQMAIDALRTM